MSTFTQCLELIVSCLVTRLNGVNGKDVKVHLPIFIFLTSPRSSKQDCPLLLDQQQTLQLPFKLST